MSVVLSVAPCLAAMRDMLRASICSCAISRFRKMQDVPAFAMPSNIHCARAVVPTPGAAPNNTICCRIKPPPIALSISVMPVGIGSYRRVCTASKKVSIMFAPVRSWRSASWALRASSVARVASSIAALSASVPSFCNTSFISFLYPALALSFSSPIMAAVPFTTKIPSASSLAPISAAAFCPASSLSSARISAACVGFLASCVYRRFAPLVPLIATAWPPACLILAAQIGLSTTKQTLPL